MQKIKKEKKRKKRKGCVHGYKHGAPSVDCQWEDEVRRKGRREEERQEGSLASKGTEGGGKWRRGRAEKDGRGKWCEGGEEEDGHGLREEETE